MKQHEQQKEQHPAVMQ